MENWKEIDEEEFDALTEEEKLEIVESMDPEERELYDNFKSFAAERLARDEVPSLTTAVREGIRERYPPIPKRVLTELLGPSDTPDTSRTRARRIRRKPAGETDREVTGIQEGEVAVLLKPSEDPDVLIIGGSGATIPLPRVKEEPEEADETASIESISSTSTADYDRREVEQQLGSITTAFQTAAAGMEALRRQVPAMRKTQLAKHLQRLAPLSLDEKVALLDEPPQEEAAPTDPPEPSTSQEGEAPPLDDMLRRCLKGMDPKEVLQSLAIGLVVRKKMSIRQASEAFEGRVTATSIQRTISGDPAHKRGGPRIRKPPSKHRSSSPAAKKSKQ